MSAQRLYSLGSIISEVHEVFYGMPLYRVFNKARHKLTVCRSVCLGEPILRMAVRRPVDGHGHRFDWNALSRHGFERNRCGTGRPSRTRRQFRGSAADERDVSGGIGWVQSVGWGYLWYAHKAVTCCDSRMKDQCDLAPFGLSLYDDHESNGRVARARTLRRSCRQRFNISGN